MGPRYEDPNLLGLITSIFGVCIQALGVLLLMKSVSPRMVHDITDSHLAALTDSTAVSQECFPWPTSQTNWGEGRPFNSARLFIRECSHPFPAVLDAG